MFVVVVYLVVGAGFQFIVRGERGLKVIPNYEFWASFVMLVLVRVNIVDLNTAAK